MASLASTSPTTSHRYNHRSSFSKHSVRLPRLRISASDQPPDNPADQVRRRELILRSSEIATIGAILSLSGKKPNYLGVQKNNPSLALCPATNNCISTAENSSDLIHYAPPWNYNPDGNRGNKSREEAMAELLQVEKSSVVSQTLRGSLAISHKNAATDTFTIKSTKPDKFTPRIVEQKDDYLHVEYESPILGLVNDVEFWFPPGNKSIVEYRSASRLGNFDFDANRKRIKALRLELEKKGWSSEDNL